MNDDGAHSVTLSSNDQFDVTIMQVMISTRRRLFGHRTQMKTGVKFHIEIRINTSTV
jgi:hypothetical protein